MITSARDTFERSGGHVNGRHLIPVGILLRCSVAFVRSLAVYLYSASGSLFTEDVLLNRIAEKLRSSFSDQMNRKVSPS